MYFVVRVNFNQQGQQSNSIQMFTDLVQAQKRYYNILAADIDKDEFQYELVQIVDRSGIVLMNQGFDNAVQPNEV